MSSSISVPRSPPSPASVPTAHKKVKLATIDGDFAEPVQQASGSGSGSSSNPTAAVGKVDNGKKNGKKESKQRSRRAPPIDEVLLHDLLSTLGWSELPKPSDPPSEAQTLGQRLWPKTAPAWKSLRGGKKAVEPVANEENENKVEQPASNDWGFTEAKFTVVALTSHGDGIAVYPVAPEKPQWAIIMPFTLPGDVVRAKVTRHQHYHSFADPLEIISSNPSASTFPIQTTRDDSLVGCKYFGTCAGCQYQSLPYEQQLALKRHVLVKAMKNFANLPSEQIPEVKETIPSPKQYNYRTKITPHFELPKALQTGKKGRQALNGAKKNNAALAAEAQAQEEQAGNEQNEIPAELDTPIGFEGKCKPGILDIEVCPIATEAIMNAMPAARAAVKQNIRSYKRGATLLLRDSLVPEVSAGGSSETEQKEAEKVDPVVDIPAGVMDEEEQGMNEGSTPEVAIATKRSSKGKTIDLGLSTDVKLKSPEEHVCVSVHSHTVTERVGDIIFQFPAGSFFQNNASILGPLTSFARDQIDKDSDEKKESYLVDAYCGSGLFSLTLAEHFTQVCGIEIDPNSIAYARHNALVNKISNATFHAGASESLFDTVTQSLAWPGDKTTLIVDPPRKGCDEGFLGQVVKFNPKRIVYVSCNVHTMARDVGQLVRNSNAGGAKGYKIDSLGAIDLFPQTHHTEGLCVLTRDV